MKKQTLTPEEKRKARIEAKRLELEKAAAATLAAYKATGLPLTDRRPHWRENWRQLAGLLDPSTDEYAVATSIVEKLSEVEKAQAAVSTARAERRAAEEALNQLNPNTAGVSELASAERLYARAAQALEESRQALAMAAESAKPLAGLFDCSWLAVKEDFPFYAIRHLLYAPQFQASAAVKELEFRIQVLWVATKRAQRRLAEFNARHPQEVQA